MRDIFTIKIFYYNLTYIFKTCAKIQKSLLLEDVCSYCKENQLETLHLPLMRIASYENFKRIKGQALPKTNICLTLTNLHTNHLFILTHFSNDQLSAPTNGAENNYSLGTQQ